MQALSFLTRYLHVFSMGVLVGGGVLLLVIAARNPSGRSSAGRRPEPPGAQEHNRLLLLAAEKFEWLFWAALGLLVLSGVGNLGVFGPGLPDSRSAWGIRLVVKLALILALIFFSIFRSLLVYRFRLKRGPGLAPLFRFFQGLYAVTALFALAVLFLGLSLAHGF